MLNSENQTWLEHFIELRQRLIKIIISFCIIFFILFYYANPIYHFIALPLIKALPVGSKMIATTIASPLIVPLKLIFNLSIFFIMPIILYHFWAFVSPGLYPEERLLIWPLLGSSLLLFVLGTLFAYQFIFPLIFRFFIAALPQDVMMMADIHSYLNFVTQMLFAFGLIFQIPLGIFMLVKVNLLSYQQLQQFRPYAIVMAFIIGMLLTPPDVMSQILLALPICLLYEIGLFFAKMIQVKAN